MADVMGRKEGYLFETISPFKLRKETLEMAVLFADRGHDLGIAPMILGGSTAPITPAGIITSLNAEVLAGLFSVYALTGRISAWYGHGSHAVDPASLLCSFGSPSQALIGIGSAQMAQFYGIPGGSNSALTDALLPDFQGGFEKAANAIFSCLAGTIGIGCQGIAGADQGFSFEQLLMDNEWLDSYNFIVDGFEATEETIAQELIESLGIGGVFMAEEHTVEHLRKSWWPSRIFNRLSFDVWDAKGKKDLLARSHELVEEYTAGYRTMEPVIADDTRVQLERIYAQARKSIVG
jgi:trimethylamine--corrinoid protein Co-methyltransferase